MLRRLSLVVSGSFLFAGVAFAEGEEGTGTEAAPTTEAAPAPTTTAAPTKGTATPGKRVMRLPIKLDPEAAKKMDECRNKCLTDKSTGDDRLKCFFGCRRGIRGFVPAYAGFKPCAEANRTCIKDKCKWTPTPMRRGMKLGAKVATGTVRPRPTVVKRPAPGHVQRPTPGQGKPGQAGTAVRPGQRPAGKPGAVVAGGRPGASKRPGTTTSTRSRMTEEMRNCLKECGTTHRACLADVLGKATPSGSTATATTTTETKTEAPAAAPETKTEEPKAEETKAEETKTEETPAESTETP